MGLDQKPLSFWNQWDLSLIDFSYLQKQLGFRKCMKIVYSTFNNFVTASPEKEKRSVIYP